jgi:hypothetical protein
MGRPTRHDRAGAEARPGMRPPADRGREGVQPPSDTRVRGAGPARKTFVQPEVCKPRIPCSRLLDRLSLMLPSSPACGAFCCDEPPLRGTQW